MGHLISLEKRTMTSSSHSLSTRYSGADSIARDAWVEIDLNCLEFNIQRIKELIKEKAKQENIAEPLIMVAVKGDAYGHGAVSIAEVLAACGISWLGVASADEGEELRKANCKLPILILSPTPSWAVKKALDLKLDITISSVAQFKAIIEALEDYKNSVPVHLKVDTGMHRLGIQENDAAEMIDLLQANKKFNLISVFSHLAKASDIETTKKQNEKFKYFIEIFKKSGLNIQFFHLASSEAANRFPFTYYDLVRFGISIYGLEAQTISDKLLPIMSVRGRINQISTIEKGESSGYGLTWTAKRKATLATIPIGYADGVGRRLSNKIKGLLQGKFVNQVGTISMDQMNFDITDVPEAKEGDVITLIGSDEHNTLYLANWAKELDTITYELACRLKARLPRIYTRKELTKQLSSSLANKKG